MKLYRYILPILGLTLLLQLILVGANTSVTTATPKASTTPILLVTDLTSPNKFGSYLGEILRAEGLNYFDVKDLASVMASDLTSHDVVILAQTSTLSSAQAALFNNYVTVDNGRLLAMRPDTQIKNLFGLNTASGSLSNGYLQISTTATVNGTTPGQGLNASPMQIHTPIDEYTPLVTATVLAQLYSNATTATTFPAVVSDGTGHAIAFTYDLASNVAYIRQGNPANANIDVDLDGITRTVDLFQTIGQPSNPWVDLNKIPIPQADEQQRLFARAVQSLLNGIMPMPQVWYFPGTAKTMLILTADAHANPTSYFVTETTSVNTHHGAISFFAAQGSNPSSADMLTWMGLGDTFGIHPYGPAGTPPEPNLTTGYNVADSWWSTAHLTVTRSNVTRNHQLAWEGWVDAASIAASHNIGMDTDFYHYGAWLKNGATWTHGYLTGSGQPMKFVKADGTILPIYQQATQIVDEQMIVDINGNKEGLNWEQALTVTQQIIDSSLANDYAALTAIFHVDYYADGNVRPWAEGTMDYAYSKGIPIWNADQWLSFTQARHDANLTSFNWASNMLTFSVNPTMTISLMVPRIAVGRAIQAVNQDGSPITFTVQTIKGVNVAFFDAVAGSHTYTVQYNSNLLYLPLILK